MQNSPKMLPPEFLASFGVRFSSDVIDLDDTEDVLFRAESVALDVLEAGLAPDELINPLEEALRHWTPEIVDEFCTSSNVNWEFGEEEEEMLRAIIKRIVLTANGGGTLARSVSEEEYRRMHAAGLFNQKAQG